jgi:hypothetical protein
MSCIALPKPVDPDSDEGELAAVAVADPSWPAIVGSIRRHAATQPPELASDLLEWADFVAGIAELQARGCSSDNSGD